MGSTCVTALSLCLMPSRRTLRVNAMARQLNDFWQRRTRCPRLTALISCLPMHPLRPLPPILWFRPWGLGFLHQACHLLARSHLQCHLLGPFLLGYPQPCPHHLCHLGLEDMVPQQQELQGLDILVTDIHILIHSHQVGCPIQECPRCSWPTMAPMA